jgi:hypothetical protein
MPRHGAERPRPSSALAPHSAVPLPRQGDHGPPRKMASKGGSSFRTLFAPPSIKGWRFSRLTSRRIVPESPPSRNSHRPNLGNGSRPPRLGGLFFFLISVGTQSNNSTAIASCFPHSAGSCASRMRLYSPIRVSRISVDVVVPVMPLKLLADPSSERDIQKFSNVKKQKCRRSVANQINRRAQSHPDCTSGYGDSPGAHPRRGYFCLVISNLLSYSARAIRPTI